MDLFIDEHPAEASVRESVHEGLSHEPRRLPPHLFYDTEGSRLFEAITRTPEYYPTRTETAILREHARTMMDALDGRASLIEFGSGSSTKTRLVLDHLQPGASYLPVDISREHLVEASAQIADAYPHIRVLPVCADYGQRMPILKAYAARHPSCVFFPGSSIGNYEPEHARSFLSGVTSLLGEGGLLLIGFDMRKDRDVLESAYNDAQGVTALFNLNMLAHVNRRLGPVFDLRRFEHRAFWNPVESRIEMHLVSTTEQSISAGGPAFHFRPGESIVTEYSYKYSPDSVKHLLRSAGFEVERIWTDSRRWFSVVLARVAPHADPALT